MSAVVAIVAASVLGLPRAASAAESGAAVPLDSFPVQAPCAFWDTFGAPRLPDRVHEGIDIAADEGRPVLAVKGGTITKIFRDSPTNRGGNSFKLTTADGTYFFYAHLSTFAEGLQQGLQVNAGDVLGYVGHTGNAGTVNHLHFEMHPQGGSPVNPYGSLRAIDACKKPATGVTGNTLPAKTPPAGTPTTAAPTTAAPTTAPPPGVAVAPSGSGGATRVTTTVPGAVAKPTPAPAAPTTVAGATSPTIVANNVNRTSAAALMSLGAPARVVNTSAGTGAKAKKNTRATYTVTGVGGVPSGASIVMVNVYANSPGSSGYLTVVPCDAGASGAATLNFRSGFMDGASTIIKPVGGKICVDSSVTTNVIIDVVAYDGGGPSAGVTPIRPTRLLEKTTLKAGEAISVQASGVGGMPPSNGATATISYSNASAAGRVWVYSCDASKPEVAQVVVGGGPGSTSVNTRLSAKGTLCVVSDVKVDVVVDVSAAWALGGSNKLKAIDPVRAYDSRQSGIIEAGRVLKLVIANDELNWNATVASVVIAGSDAAETGTITAWPCGQNQPNTATVTVAKGRTASASSIVGLGGGKLCVSPSVTMHIIVDVNGGA